MAPVQSTLLAMTGAVAALSLGPSVAAQDLDQSAIVLQIATGELEGFANFVAAIGALGDDGLEILSKVCKAEEGATVLVPLDAALPTSAVETIGATSLKSFVLSHVALATLTDATLPTSVAAEYETLASVTSVDSSTINADLVGIGSASFYKLSQVLPVTVKTLLNGYVTQSGVAKWVTPGQTVLSNGIVDALTEARNETSAEVTAFVPSEEAFNGVFRAYPDLLVEPLNGDSNTLSAVLGLHVVGGADAALPEGIDASGEFFPMQTAGVTYKGINQVIGTGGLTPALVKKLNGLVNFVAGQDSLTTITSLIKQDATAADFMDYTSTGENVLVEIAKAFAKTKAGNAALTGRVVFAPTNAAFAELDANLVKGLTTVKHNFPLLLSVLFEHVGFSEAQIQAGEAFTVTNLNEREVSVDESAEKVSVANVEKASAGGTFTSDSTSSVLLDSAVVVNKVLLPVFDAPELLDSMMKVVRDSEAHTVLEFIIDVLKLGETLSNVFDKGQAPVLMAPTDAAFIAWAKATLDAEFADAPAMIAALPSVLASGETIPGLVQQLVLDHVVTEVTDYNAALKTSGLAGCGVMNTVVEVATLGPNKLKLMGGTTKMVKQTKESADFEVADGLQRLNGYVVVLSSVLDTFGSPAAATMAPAVTMAPTMAPVEEEENLARNLGILGGVFAALGLSYFFCKKSPTASTSTVGAHKPNPAANPVFDADTPAEKAAQVANPMFEML